MWWTEVQLPTGPSYRTKMWARLVMSLTQPGMDHGWGGGRYTCSPPQHTKAYKEFYLLVA